MLSIRHISNTLPKYVLVRSFASAPQVSDPIQKLFVEKIREYSAKSKTAPNGLVDSNENLLRQLKEDRERVANLYGIKNEDDITNLGLKFDDTIQLDSINLRK